MKSRNPMKGRSFAGSLIARSGTQPKPRTGSPSGSFVGTGVNSKTAASPQHNPSNASRSPMVGNQLDSITRQAPEPFRNPAFGATPKLPSTSQSGAPGPYQTFKGSRISIDDGNTNSLGGQPSAVGVNGARGMGRDNGKVAGLAQPRRAGSPHFQGGMAQKKSTRPSFYGR